MSIQMLSDFVVFIFSHGRPDNFFTLDTLRKHGYTGKVYIIIDNEDKTANRYYEKFGGDMVIMFDKMEAAKLFDVGDNFSDRRAIVYARNKSFEIARELGYKYFIQLEDDYIGFAYKADSKDGIIERQVLDMDAIFGYLLEYYKAIPAKCIAIAQGGDFIGGGENDFYTSIGRRRKVMNSLLCCVDRPFQFVGRMNDDVNTYVESGRRGNLFLTVPRVMLHQVETQKAKGGHSDIYKKFGTYVKSFISVMYAPSCVTVRMMGAKNRRIHHSVSWDNAVPCIISEQWRKATE